MPTVSNLLPRQVLFVEGNEAVRLEGITGIQACLNGVYQSTARLHNGNALFLKRTSINGDPDAWLRCIP